MKKLVSSAAVLLGTAAAGILVWRKVETDRMRNDLWAEAERTLADQEAQDARETQSAPAARS